jgi:inosose dehydratase
MSAEFAYAQWPWGTGSKEEFIVSCRDLSEVGFEYFESVKAFIDTFKDDISEFKAITAEYNVRPISFYFHLSDNYDFDIADLKDKIGFVAANDIKTISVQGKWSPEPATQADLEYTTKTIIEYGKICKEYGITPCVHPHHNTSVMNEKEIDFVMANTDPDEIAFGPDTAHLAAGGCDPVAIFKRY